ncbi:hypothetical protein EIP91_009348 [Steccherinum ochraceum]|uniref:Uncharacterized protein n=1 Tax=Steccherinum ochraceum TaxID=92696 RepID=A0A4R0RXQ9_9APHY|nr:hypothetical protein EIP91_009348 [Steccherinum ochraceum]
MSHSSMHRRDTRPASGPPLSVKLKADHLRILEKHVQEHEQAIVVLKIRYNSALPAVGLPSEILAEVFLYCRAAMDSYRFVTHTTWQKTSTAFPYHWMGICHVCHRWREVTLSTPELWATIHLSCASEQVNEAFLTRSKSALLSLDALESELEPSLAVLRLSLPHLHRARSIDFELTQDAYQLLSFQLSLVVMPLETLILRLPHSTWFARDPDTQVPSFVSPRLSGLRSLILRKYSIPWRSHLFPETLTMLEIKAVAAESTVLEVVEAIRGLHSLRQLKLLSVFDPLSSFEATAAPPLVETPVTFIHLKELFVTFIGPIQCAYFLDHISLPPTNRLSLDIHSEAHSDEMLSGIISAVRPSVVSKFPTEPTADGHAAALILTRHEFSVLELEPSDPLAKSTGNQPFFNMSFDRGEFDGDGYQSIMTGDTGFIAGLPLSNVTKLVVHTPPLQASVWESLFRTIPQIEVLEIFDHNALSRDLIRTLIAGSFSSSSLGQTDSSASLTTPRLKSVSLDMCEYWDSEHESETPGRSQTWLYVDALLEAFALRVERGGAEVEELVIKKCNVLRQQHIDRLQEHVRKASSESASMDYAGSKVLSF